MIDQDRERKYNPFAPTMSNGGGLDVEIPQTGAAQAAAIADQGPSAKEQAIGLAMDKGMNYGVDKGAGVLSKAIGGLGKKAATDVVSKHVAKNAIAQGGAKGAGTAAGGGLAAAGAAVAPALPFIIGAMALKSIFKK